MLVKPFAVVLAVFLAICSVDSTFAASDNKRAEFEARVKEAVFKLGTGSKARVEVKLRDKTKIKGYIAEASDEAFVVVDSTTSAEQIIVPYGQVKQIKGQNLSTGAKIAIGVGITVGVLAVLILIFYDHIVAY